ncbi:hypothetical protein AX769_08995 [Frondihabitans sp. PAMC 28766]|uniref:LolA family protein n=1 Tax=Frondihabitans sp. PAMC 28766 TaxID=1795630 RepID=UPI00078E5D9F|nr:DUF2092 domain-containing protein [Frondihabitans sp. PAMC 28766]AMM20275.1 hypothetical protein AX769_08995 [Frondihabitans sp. PAMC 28766]
MNKSRLRWIPAIAVPAIVIAGAVAVPQMANADAKLPAKSALGIVSLAQKSAGTSFSGTVTETANLGLPDISSSAFGGGGSGSSASDTLSQLTGSHTAKVFVSGESQSRVQLISNLQETDVIRNGQTLWTYDSKTNAVTHVTLPSESSLPRHATPQSGATTSPTAGAMPTPADIASQVLSNVKKYTTVSTTDNAKVAGRTAYGITLTPKDSSTLVGHVTLDVDSATGVPLRAVITAKGQKAAALSVAFSKIDFSTPSASTFAFTPPKGAKVKNVTVPTHDSSRAVHPGVETQSGAASSAEKKAKAEALEAKYEPSVIGSGWSTIVGLTLSPATAKQTEGTGDGSSSKLLDEVLTPVSGGRVLQTSLVSVFITDSGRAYVGAVSAKTLEAAVASQK